jgi:hypothetical protein
MVSEENYKKKCDGNLKIDKSFLYDIENNSGSMMDRKLIE